MRAEHTRPGGRHLLDQRGAYDTQPCATAAPGQHDATGEVGYQRPAWTAPLWAFLPLQTILEMSRLATRLPVRKVAA